MFFKKSDENNQMEEPIAILEVTALGIIADVKALIAKGCDVNQKDRYGNCAVLMAASRNDMGILRELVAAGGRVDIEDHFHHTPRSWAEENDSNEMISFIDTTMQSYLKNK
jgi:ankyrin repeat protein